MTKLHFVLIKAEKAAHQFWKYINKFNCLKTSIIINLFHTLVVPVILYCSEIWFPFNSWSSTDKTHIKNFYSKNIKRILGVPLSTANAAVYLELNLCSISTLVSINIFKIFARLKDNELNKQLLSNLLSIDCSWSKFCNKLLGEHNISAEYMNKYILSVDGLQLNFKEDK